MTPSWTYGRIVWRDCMTNDVESAKAFYTRLFGWKYERLGDQPYFVIKNGERSIGGIWQRTKEDTDPPAWMAYVSVPDVDNAAKTAKQNGGRIVHGPTEFPGVGRFAAMLDPDGALIMPFHSNDGDKPPEAPKHGDFCWETLITKDEARAQQFYGELFGWKRAVFGEGATVFSLDGSAEQGLADMQRANRMPPMWLSYVSIENVEASNAKVHSAGGSVIVPLIEIPNVGRISLIRDSTGAQLGLYQQAPRS